MAGKRMLKSSCLNPSLPVESGGAPKKKHSKFDSASGGGRLRGRALVEMRRSYFSARPLCVHCLSKSPPQTSLAVELDHIVSIANGGPPRPDAGGYQGLCKECHAVKTQKELGFKPKSGFKDGRVVW